MLRPRQAKLIELLQQLNFGRLAFFIQGGEPDFNRPMKTWRTVKLEHGVNGPRPESNREDVTLCERQRSFLDVLKQTSDGDRVEVEVRHGLPFLVEIEQEHHTA